MSICPFLKLRKNSATCDPESCPKHKNRDMITPECWRLRRLETKEPLDQTPKERIYRMTKIRCPQCKYKFPAREGIIE